MGDRSNVFIQMRRDEECWKGIGVYSHWGGQEFQNAAIAAAKLAAPRLGDDSYFARRLVHLLLSMEDREASETGHGLWTEQTGMPDNEHDILVINAETGLAWYSHDKKAYTDDAPKGAKHLKDWP